MANVELHKISKQFRGSAALQDVSFDIQDGEFFVLLGPTGAGKTTTLRIIAGLEKQNAGTVLFDGEVVDTHSPAERDIAFVFQQYSLYPTMSVYDNLAFPLRSPLRKTPEDQIKRRVTEAAEKLRISHLLERKTARLSGGEMQRVSIGRAIVREPRIFLMDEPLSNLDAKLRESLRIELVHIQKTQHSTTLYVTHDQVEALTLADRIAVLREGRIVQLGAPQDIYDRPANIFVAQLVGSPRINLLPAHCVDNAIQIGSSALQLPLSPALRKLPEKFTLGIRPEDIQPMADGVFTGEVALVEPLGAETILYLRSGSETLVSMVAGMSQWRIGELLHFNFVQEHLHYFDLTGMRIDPAELLKTTLLEAAATSGDPFRVSPYYDEAEQAMEWQWTELIWPTIQSLDFRSVVDLAAGHGRNTVRLLPYVGQITLVDINQECLDYCKARFQDNEKISYVKTDGISLQGIVDESITFVYCFDAMVHFEGEVIREYLKECYRVLTVGGHCFCHHSNYTANPGGDFKESPHWRNFMSKELFAQYSMEAGLEVVTQQVIDWGHPVLDCLTVLRK